MEYIYICPKCGTTYSGKDDKGMVCSDCHSTIEYSGYTGDEWYALPRLERNRLKEEVIKSGIDRLVAIREEKKKQEEERQIIEHQKQEYANSFNEYYEYDVVTIVNEGHGRVDKENMLRILSEHAKQGWKLHSIYSNELGKNAIRILGYGVNATACEDVLIFERRIEKLPEQ